MRLAEYVHDSALVSFECEMSPKRLRKASDEDLELAVGKAPRGTIQTLSAVYVVSNAANSLLKIGYADNLKQRISGMRTGSPVELKLQHFIYFVDCMIAGMVEKDAHDELAEYRRRGEWFEITIEQAGEAIAKSVTSRRLKWWTEAERRDLGKHMAEHYARHQERQRLFGT
jgi:hypothetical protein